MERGDYTMKRILIQIFFAVAVMVCFSMTAMAQQDGEKKPRPPKEPPPVIVPGDKPKKPPKDDKPKDEKDKKPEAMVFYFRNE
jgi:hypothetical protein